MSRKTRLWVLLFPLIFFMVNRTWMYCVLNHPDAGMYTGYFLHPDLLYDRFPDAYFGSRVLHIFWGWLAFRWMPLEAALLLYKGGLFYAGYLFLCGALFKLFRNERAAFLGAALGLTHGLAIFTLSWNYVGSTCLVLLLGNLWALGHMRDTKRLWAWQMAAGAFYVGAICTYLLLPILAPAVFALFAYCLPRWTWRELCKGVGWAAVGGAAVVFVQGLMSLMLGGPFLFFLDQVNKAQSFAGEDWFIPFEYWWRTAVWLPYFGLVLVLGLLAFWRGGRFAVVENEERVMRRGAWLAGPLPFVSAAFWVSFILFLVFDAGGIWPMLQNNFLSCFLLPLAFLVMGGWLAWLMQELSPGRQWLVVVVGLLAILVVYTQGGTDWLKNWGQTPALVFLIPIFLAALAAGRPRPAWLAALVFAGSLAGLDLYLATPQHLSDKLLNRYVAQNRALYSAAQWIEPWDRAGQVWFWDNPDRPDGSFHRMINYMYLWGKSTYSEHFPGEVGGVVHSHETFDARKVKLAPGMRVVLFDPTADELAAAQAAVGADSLQLRPLAKMTTPAGGAIPEFNVQLWQVAPLGTPRGVAVDLAGAKLADSVRAGPAAEGKLYHYPAGLTGAAVGYPLPASTVADSRLCHVLIGGNAHTLIMRLTDGKHRILAETVVDAGQAIRDWWLNVPPGSQPTFLEIAPRESGWDASFTVKSVEF